MRKQFGGDSLLARMLRTGDARKKTRAVTVAGFVFEAI
jgi:hypothetical protein